MITTKAPAKINLYLEIVGKRPDGYHLLETIMQTVSLYDELTFEPADEIQLLSVKSDSANDAKTQKEETVNANDSGGTSVCSLPLDDRNIIVKAARALQEKFCVKQGAKITLKKNIPIGAGLGGGSSDAAAVLQSLVKLWNIKASKSGLEKIAASLGADVPFFLTGGAALCKGIGEIITPLFPPVFCKEEEEFLMSEVWENPLKEFVVGIHNEEYSKLPLVLVNPNIFVPTQSVYKKVNMPFTNTRKIDKIKSLVEKGALNYKNADEVCFNRLEDFVLPYYQEIEDVKRFLTQSGCAALMSGSGSTVFGIYNPKDKSGIEAELKKRSWKYWFVETI